MKLITATLRAALVLVTLVSSVNRVEAGPAVGGPCCVCTSCSFSEHCFTGLSPSESGRCTQLCNGVNCSAGLIEGQPCETFTPLCEVITPAPAVAPAPAMHLFGLVLVVLGIALVGVLRLVRERSKKTGLLN